MIRFRTLRRVLLATGAALFLVGGTCPMNVPGPAAETPKAFAGTVQASFANRDIPISQRSGSGRFRWAGVDEGQPSLEVYQGILPGFSNQGATDVTIDLSSLLADNALSTGSVAITGKVVTSGGRVLDLADVVTELEARPAGLTGIIVTFNDGTGTKEYEINFDTQGTGSSSFLGNVFAGAVSIVVRQLSGTVLDTATGSVNAIQVTGPVNDTGGNRASVQMFVNDQLIQQLALGTDTVITGNIQGDPDLEYGLFMLNASLQSIGSQLFSSCSIIFRQRSDVPGGALNAAQINGFLVATVYSPSTAEYASAYYCNCGSCPSFSGSQSACSNVATVLPVGSINLTLADGRLFGAFDYRLTDGVNNQIRIVGDVNVPDDYFNASGIQLPTTGGIPLP